MDSVAAQPLHAEEKGDGRLELRGQEQHLEVEEGLLVHCEVGLACGGNTAHSEGVNLHSHPTQKPVRFKDLWWVEGPWTEHSHVNPTWFHDLL